MRTIRIAVGSNDGTHVVPGHFGESRVFLVYELTEDGNYRLVEKRENTSPTEGPKSHDVVEKRRAVLSILSDCQVFVGGRMSPSFAKLRDGSSVQPVVSEVTPIPEFVNRLGADFEHLFALVQARTRGERPPEIPVIKKKRRDPQVT